MVTPLLILRWPPDPSDLVASCRAGMRIGAFATLAAE
jgi:hypothetical protein